MLVVTAVSKAWLYVRADQSVRIVVDRGNVAVYGPGPDFNHSQFTEEMDAVLHHAAVEEALVREGWMLEQLTTERRSGDARRAVPRGGTRRRSLLRVVTTPA
jgi:hypothetical protein